EPFLLSVTAQAVKDDGCRAADGEVVPARGAADRLEDVVGAPEDVLGQSPAGAEDEQSRPRVVAQAASKVHERQAPAARARRCGDEPGEDARLPLDVRDDGIEIRREAREGERLLARVVVGGARTGV